MSDLISRQAAIDAICTEGTQLERKGTVAMCEIKQWCVDILEAVPSAQPESGWIPCSERLPEIDEEVLVTDGELYWVCSFFESPDIEDGLYQWEDNYGYWHEFETWVAWMPLPELYMGLKGEDK